MKTTYRILILFVVLSFMACHNQMHVVTLYVDTANITIGSMDQYANFDQPKGISNEDFTIYVRRGDRVIWNAVALRDSMGVALSNEVKITAIIDEPDMNYRTKKNTNFFDDKTLEPDPDNPIKGIIDRTIKNGKPGDVQKYSLEFTINGKAETFRIDPQMEMY